MTEDLKNLIAGVAAGAAEGAAALRSNGMPVEFDSYTVEATIDPTAASSSTVIRLDFVLAAPPR